MIVICDTSPLNYLILIDHIEIVPKLMTDVVAPPQVLAELQRTGAADRVRAWAAQPPAWLQVRAPMEIAPDLALHIGESAAISLALELKPAHSVQLLMDERMGRRVARSLGLPTLGTLAVLRDAARGGLIDIETAISRLRQTRFRATEQLYEQLRQSVRREKDT
ncbi:MAG TPA: DUF3368 domain-containing protein [Phycisphaerales bacterium]|nr:DUF3368 domain-containing protein [Phycisphaerales bacterium]